MAQNSPQSVLSAAPIHKDILIVGSEQDYPPFATGMTDADAGGFTVELWKVVAAEAGLKYRIRVLPFHELLQEFKDGKIDVLINLAQSEERHQFADFTVPHVIVHGAIFVRKGETKIHTEADLAGESIIVLNADLAHDYAVSKGWTNKLVLVDTSAEGFKLLASGKYDAMLLSKLSGLQTLQKLGLTNIEAINAKAGFSQKFSFAVHKGQSELLEKINEGMAISKADGSYNAIYDQWFGVYETKPLGLHDVLKYLLPVVVVCLGGFGYLFYRRQLERAEAERKYRDLYDHAPDMFLSVDANTRNVLDCNMTLLDVTGYSREEIIGKSVIELYHSDCTDRVQTAFLRFLDVKSLHGVELELRRKDGSLVDVSLSSSAVCDQHGEILHSRSILHDITARKQAEEKVRLLSIAIEQSPVSVVIADIDGNIEYVNPRFTAITGFGSDEVIGQNPRILQSGLTLPETYLELWETITHGHVWHGELINKRKNGEHYWEEAHISPVTNEAGLLTHYVAAKIDVTQRKWNEEALRQSEERFKFMLENSPIAVRISDIETSRVLFYNQRYAELIGSGTDVVIGINPRQYYANPQDYDVVIERINKGERVTNKLVELVIPGEVTKTKWALASYLNLEFDNKPAVLGWFYDISDRKTIEDQVQHLAHYDPLTDLPNRTLLTDRLQQGLAIAKRDKTLLALLFIDLDKFKQVNDTLGHNVGDLLLKEVARRIQTCLRDSDTVARIGGDEFVVLLPTIDTEQGALGVADKIRHALNQLYDVDGHQVNISSSTGIAVYPLHGADETQLLNNADFAMYRVKTGQGDSVKVYCSDMSKIID